jgi:hypothetical protein
MPVYRKGEDQMGLQQSALNQKINEMSAMRNMTGEEYTEHNYNSGKTGAERVVYGTNDTNDTIGPVSGSHLAKLKAKKVADKKTAAREMKRR